MTREWILKKSSSFYSTAKSNYDNETRKRRRQDVIRLDLSNSNPRFEEKNDFKRNSNLNKSKYKRRKFIDISISPNPDDRYYSVISNWNNNNYIIKYLLNYNFLEF